MSPLIDRLDFVVVDESLERLTFTTIGNEFLMSSQYKIRVDYSSLYISIWTRDGLSSGQGCHIHANYNQLLRCGPF